MYRGISEELLDFLQKSPTAFHAVENIKKELNKDGFVELLEGKPWKMAPGGKYYVTRNNSSIIALKVGSNLENYSFNVAASHSDCPTFKLKENAELEVKGKYTQLNTEGYGGMICSTWFDKPLSIAGRLLIKDGNELKTQLINIDRDLVLIPNMAIHMNRAVNDGYAYNKQIDMLPLFGGADCKPGDFMKLVAKEAGVQVEDIYGSDLYLYNRTAPSIWGANDEFISSQHLDDLQCAFTSLKGFLAGGNDQSIDVLACFDNEEVGSGTKQGAASTLLYDVLKRANSALGKTEEDFYCAIASSFMLSADNAHAVHPHHPQKTDATNCVYMNEGIVVKSHAGQKYTSDAVSVAVFKDLCKKANVPVQFFANRSDEAGGSTLGNIAMAQVSMNSVDIGLPQLAMHSTYETAGIKDTYYMIQVMTEFFNSHISEVNSHPLKVDKEIEKCLFKKRKDVLKTNILLSEILDQMKSFQDQGKTVQQVMTKGSQAFVDQIDRKINYKEKINQLKQRDSNKYEMSGILLTMCIYIVLLFVKELVGNHYLINYYIDLLVAVIMLVISVKQLLNQRQLIKRYQVSFQPFIIEIVSIVISLLISILFYNSPFDITFVILVVAFFTSKKMYSKSLSN